MALLTSATHSSVVLSVILESVKTQACCLRLPSAVRTKKDETIGVIETELVKCQVTLTERGTGKPDLKQSSLALISVMFQFRTTTALL